MSHRDRAMIDTEAASLRRAGRLHAWQLELLAFVALACAIAWFCAAGVAPGDQGGPTDVVVSSFLMAVTGVATLLAWFLVGAHRAPPSFGQLLVCALAAAILFVLMQGPLLAVLGQLVPSDSAASAAFGWLSMLLAAGGVGFFIEGLIALVAALAGATAYGLARWLLLRLVRRVAPAGDMGESAGHATAEHPRGE
jgi:hypothetical protein